MLVDRIGRNLIPTEADQSAILDPLRYVLGRGNVRLLRLFKKVLVIFHIEVEAS